MKKKFSLLLNVAMLALCVCAIAIGVYSAKTASLNVTGSIGFTAHNCDVDISGYIYGHSTTVNGEPTLEPTTDEQKQYLTYGTSNTEATESAPLKISGTLDNALSFGNVFFSDMGESGEVEPIYIELTITNKSKFEVLLEDLTIVAENSSYTVVCTNPLHELYTDEDKTTTLQYILRPAKVDGVYQNISTPVKVSLSMKFSKLNTDISSAGFTFDEATGTISGVPSYEDTGSDLIVIPSKFSDNETIFTKVFYAEDDALENLYGYVDGVKIVVLKGIETIGNSAFSNIESNRFSIALPNTITSIDSYAFRWSPNLTSISIPSNVTSIGQSAFSGTSLTNISIPDGVTSIGGYAFSGTSLTSITIPEGVTSIDENPFCDCSGLTSIVVDSENTTYDSRNNCNAIIETDTNTLVAGCKATVIPSGVTNIGNYAFSGFSGLTSITIPEGVTNIGDAAFAVCTSLTSITIPEGVTSIGKYAFSGCTSLSRITIPSSITSIGVDAFSSCSSLTSITIPESVTSIANGAFSSCSSLTSITIPESVTSIGDEAFRGCTSLTSITIPSSVTSIGKYAFSLCISLTSITIPNGVNSIGDSAFDACYSLIEVCNLSSLTITAGSSANGYVAKYAKGVITNPLDSKLTTINGYVIYNESETSKILVKYIGTNTSLELPSVVTSIHDYAFYANRNITSITIPSSVTSIGKYAFIDCSKLTSVTFGNTTGWYVGDTAGTKTTAIDSTALENTSTAATYLTDTYYNKYWTRG